MNRPSQLQQDKKLLKYLDNKRDGYYVDIGAHDGIDLSNTYSLEKDYDWTGICVEPIKTEYDKCVVNRPKSICVNQCVYDHTGKCEFYEVVHKEVSAYNMLSGCLDDIDDKSKQQEGTITTKDCITLTDLLDNNHAPAIIDFLSVDTEGSELKILQSLDHHRYFVRYITCEHNYDPKKRKDIRDYLESVGYKFYEENSWDDIYVK